MKPPMIPNFTGAVSGPLGDGYFLSAADCKLIIGIVDEAIENGFSLPPTISAPPAFALGVAMGMVLKMKAELQQKGGDANVTNR